MTTAATLASLQAQLDAVRTATQQVQAPPPSVPVFQPQAQQPDVQQMIRAIVQEELRKVQPESKPDPKSALLAAVGAALTHEEQVWLSDPTRLKGLDEHLPKFLSTEDGKLAIQSCMMYLKKVFP